MPNRPRALASCRRFARHGVLAALVLLLTACSTYNPNVLDIDRSIQATSQNSRVEFIVLHYTSTGNEASLNILSRRNVSSHYLITREERPHVYQLVDESRRAWHAGVSAWFGRSDMNSGSIGIEIVNQGLEGEQWDTYDPVQMQVLASLLHEIIKRHQIKPHNIVGHSDIAPQRKIDPGPRFPWKQLADQGIGRWYDEDLARQYEQEFLAQGLPDAAWTQAALQRLGYTVPDTGQLDSKTRNVIAAFQMHYRPDRYDGVPDAQTLAIMKALR
ncbi:N-acetylmuramoyl-L-alanine amidase [Pusillimonas sp. MFBS29]|uniref:N-acetylmuramoyl-L-alanine amidase n=1 Tax=Pusillimonas sp. MFBS29 TaxID=2886690 RepID=UPI001D1179AC|nr:N-acetylmuramoyl-L-alanine amidase [Pusillimonas sp. MFBS29]MCC2595141.1 N-acetylmuramoyl-L-alanine amidase [Pusillimonas sp. MFBS29]